MKHLLLLLRVSSILWVTSTCAGQSTMLKEDFSEHGFSIVLPDEPTFASELKSLGFSSPSTPYDVVVKNTSQRPVAAFGIRFLYQFADGTSAPFSSIIALFPQGLLDPRAPHRQDRQPLIEAGAALLVSPDGDGIVRLAPSSLGVSAHVYPRKPVSGIKVETDAVVFADGGVWGPDDLQVAQRLESKVRAQQSLVEEISQRLASRENLGTVLKQMADSLPSANTGSALFDVSNLYPQFRRECVRQLLSTYGRHGEAAVKEEITRLTFSVIPNIHQEGGK